MRKDIAGYDPVELVKRAALLARPNRHAPAPKWVAIRDTFGLGSTSSVALCRRFDMDPHADVGGKEILK